MVLLTGMSALFGKQDGDVEYSAEANIPNANIAEVTVHHESLHLMKLHEIITQFGGTTLGELALHNNGDSLDTNDFELKNMEDDNV